MLRFTVNTFHPAFIYLILAIFYVGFAFAMYEIATKKLGHNRQESDRLDEVVNISIATISSVYSILVGFIVFLLWSSLQNAEQVVVDESSKLTIMWYNSQVFPKPVKQSLHKLIEEYVNTVTKSEWPAMAIGASDPQVNLIINKMYKTLQNYSPNTPITQTFYEEMVTALSNVVELRNHRLSMLDVSIPAAWYLFLFIGGFAIIMLNAFVLRQHKLQLAMHILLALTITFYLTAITALSYPFSGYLSVSNKLFLHKDIMDMNPTKVEMGPTTTSYK